MVFQHYVKKMQLSIPNCVSSDICVKAVDNMKSLIGETGELGGKYESLEICLYGAPGLQKRGYDKVMIV